VGVGEEEMSTFVSAGELTIAETIGIVVGEETLHDGSTNVNNLTDVNLPFKPYHSHSDC
jgi:hypothetical protein